MKNILILLLLILNFTTNTFANFNDISESDKEFNAIRFLKQIESIKGYGDGTFKKNNLISRVEFLKIFIESSYLRELESEKIENCIKENNQNKNEYIFFPDVPKDKWFAKYVCVAKIEGIINGYSDGYFRPHWKISYPEVAKIIIEGSGEYTEKNNHKTWYIPYIKKLNEINAAPSSNPSFKDKLTRGDIAEIVFKSYKRISNKSCPESELQFFNSKTHNINFYYSNECENPIQIIENEDFIGIASLVNQEKKHIYCKDQENCFNKNNQTYQIRQKIEIIKKSNKDSIEEAIQKFIEKQNSNIDFLKCEIKNHLIQKNDNYKFLTINAKENFISEYKNENHNSNIAEPVTHIQHQNWHNDQSTKICSKYSTLYYKKHIFVYNKNNPNTFLIIPEGIESYFVTLRSIKIK